MRVLLLVDLINCFFPGGSMGVDGAHEIIPLINRLMREGEYDAIIAVNDAHGPGHVSWFTSHPGGKVRDVVTLPNGTKQILWPVHGDPETFGGKFHPDLDLSLIHHILSKGVDQNVDSYSAFFDNNQERETGLRELIDRLAAERGESRSDVRIDTVGLALDYCAGWSAKDGVKLGYDVYMVTDCTRAILDPGKTEVDALRDLVQAKVKLTDSREILHEVRQSREIIRPHERHFQLCA